MITTDIAELNLPKTCQLDFPDPDDLLNFKLIISPDEVSTVSGVAMATVNWCHSDQAPFCALGRYM